MFMSQSEYISLKLRSFYEKSGLSFCRVKPFEDYDFYADKKDFLISNSILSFTDLNGRLLALRPDVTLSVIKRGLKGRFFYDEKVYRPDENSASFTEINQTGVEFLGDLAEEDLVLLVKLALKTLEIIADGRDFVLDTADAQLFLRNLEFINPSERQNILKCMMKRDYHGLRELNAPVEITELLKGSIKSQRLNRIIQQLEPEISSKIREDYSALMNVNYYSGIVLKGYIQGFAKCVISGGEYDGMLRSMMSSFRNGAGFGVYVQESGQ